MEARPRPIEPSNPYCRNRCGLSAIACVMPEGDCPANVCVKDRPAFRVRHVEPLISTLQGRTVDEAMDEGEPHRRETAELENLLVGRKAHDADED